MRLDGPTTGQLREALTEAFDPNSFALMLSDQLDEKVYLISTKSGFPDIVQDVINHFNQRYIVEQLIIAARKTRPADPYLYAFDQEIDRAAQMYLPGSGGEQKPLPASRLERVVNVKNGFLEPREWRRRMAQVENRVCRVAVDGGWGTGFLIDSNVVITNYHVVEPVIKGEVDPKGVVLRFDYALLDDGETKTAGTEYRLDDDWLIEKSPYSPRDMELAPLREPTTNELDYALLRVADDPGNKPVGGEANKASVTDPRGWIEVPTEMPDFQPDSALLIMQHPGGKTLKLALDTAANLQVNPERTRVRYRTNTLPGSSGSPCFDANWELVALHHAGDPNYDEFHHPSYNQGIPFATIVESLGDAWGTW